MNNICCWFFLLIINFMKESMYLDLSNVTLNKSLLSSWKKKREDVFFLIVMEPPALLSLETKIWNHFKFNLCWQRDNSNYYQRQSYPHTSNSMVSLSYHIKNVWYLLPSWGASNSFNSLVLVMINFYHEHWTIAIVPTL